MRMCSIEIKKKRLLTVGQRIRTGSVEELSLSLAVLKRGKIQEEEGKYLSRIIVTHREGI